MYFMDVYKTRLHEDEFNFLKGCLNRGVEVKTVALLSGRSRALCQNIKWADNYRSYREKFVMGRKKTDQNLGNDLSGNDEILKRLGEVETFVLELQRSVWELERKLGLPLDAPAAKPKKGNWLTSWK